MTDTVRRMLDNISTLLHMAYLGPGDHLYLGFFSLERLEKHSNVQAVCILIKVVSPQRRLRKSIAKVIVNNVKGLPIT